MDKVDIVMITEQGCNLIALALTHHARVDINTGQLISDGLMYQYSRDGTVDSAG